MTQGHMHYDYFDKLSIEDFDAVVELTRKPSFKRIEVFDYWQDDHTHCIDVKFTTWQRGVVKCAFTALALHQVAAFYYPESPIAQKVLRELFEGIHPK